MDEDTPELYYPWKFTTDDGEVIVAKFKDSEIEELKKKYPGNFWKD